MLADLSQFIGNTQHGVRVADFRVDNSRFEALQVAANARQKSGTSTLNLDLGQAIEQQIDRIEDVRTIVNRAMAAVSTDNARFIAEPGKPEPEDQAAAEEAMDRINADEEELRVLDENIDEVGGEIESLLQNRDVLEKRRDEIYPINENRFISETDQLRMMGIASISPYFDEAISEQHDD